MTTTLQYHDNIMTTTLQHHDNNIAITLQHHDIPPTAKLDDVVDAVPIHLCCGLWGLIAPALFSKREHVALAYNHYTNITEVPCGILQSCDGLGRLPG